MKVPLTTSRDNARKLEPAPRPMQPMWVYGPHTGYAGITPEAATKQFVDIDTWEAPDASTLDDDALVAELSKKSYAKWVDQVMLRGNANPHWVWSSGQLGPLLAKDDPARWAALSKGIYELGHGWEGLCYLHPDWFVWNGSEDGEDFLRRRQYQDRTNICEIGDAEHRVPWWCAICYYFAAFLGTIFQVFWCCCGYVVPNWCCAWRWPCCQAPNSCCCRSYWDYDEIEPDIDTGDILLFCGDNLTRLGGQCHYSHVGCAFRDTAGVIGRAGLLYVFESNFGRGGWDHCDLRLLREKVATYKGGTTDCAWRPLNEEIEDLPAARQRIGKAILEFCGCKYDHDLMHMFMAAADFCPCFEQRMGRDENTMFCSEAVAHVLQSADVLSKPPDGPPAAEYLPRDFGTRAPGCNAESELANDILGPVYMIQRTNKNAWTALQFH